MKILEFKNGSSIHAIDNVEGRRSRIRYFDYDAENGFHPKYYKEISTGVVWELVYIDNLTVTLMNQDAEYEVTYEEFGEDFIEL